VNRRVKTHGRAAIKAAGGNLLLLPRAGGKGGVVKAARYQKGLTQEALGDLVGVKKMAILKIENKRGPAGNSGCNVLTLEKMAKVLGLTFKQVLYPFGPPPKVDGDEDDAR